MAAPQQPASAAATAPAADLLKLSPCNIPASVRTQSVLCGVTLRSLVSKKKLRFVSGGYDIDLSYITDRLIAMGYPSAGVEAVYRNPVDAVRRFLEGRHPNQYRIWNLCSERAYGPGTFACEIERFAWEDHCPPPFALVRPTCESIESWLAADRANVAAIHCKAGKGRTGTIIAAHLVHQRACPSAAAALRVFAERRTRDGKGVTIPSQMRSVKFYALQRAAIGRAEGASAKNGSSRVAAIEAPPAVPEAASLSSETAALIPPAEGSSNDGEGAVAQLAPVAAAADAVHAVLPPFQKFPARARVLRVDPLPPATPRGAGQAQQWVALTIELHRDSERVLGFRVRSGSTLEDSSGIDSGALAAYGAGEGQRVMKHAKAVKRSKFSQVMSKLVVSAVVAAPEESGEGAVSSSEGSGAGARPAAPSSSASSASEPSNSVLPVHVSQVLREGDVVLAVNGVSLASRAFDEAVSLLRSGADPLTIVVKQAADAAGSSSGGGGAAAPTEPSAFLSKVSQALGPWAPGSDGILVPAPVVNLGEVSLSTAPAPSSGGVKGLFKRLKAGLSCLLHRSTTVTASSTGVTVQVWGGHHCRALLFDSSKAPGEVAVTLPAAGTRGPITVDLSSAGVSVAGDFKVVVKQAAAGKALAVAWLHTAFLPLPDTVANAVAGAAEAAGKSVVRFGAAELAASQASAAPSLDLPSPSSLVLLGTDVPAKLALADASTAGLACPTLGALFTAAGSSSASIPASSPVATGSLALPKAVLDKALKDKKHRRTPADFTVTLGYSVAALPAVVGEALASVSGVNGCDAASGAAAPVVESA